MSLNIIQSRIDELFTDNSNIYSIEKIDIQSFRFFVDDVIYFVKLMFDGEIVFYYKNDINDYMKTKPTKLGKNQFKILNTVIECIKLIMSNKENHYDQIFFSGDVNNGLAKVYSLICKKIKNTFSDYTFSENMDIQNKYFVFTKKENINELFTDNSNIYPITQIDNNWYEFTDGTYKYRVRETSEIIFSYYNERNEMWMTSPTKNNKNNFKILNTVIYCFKEIIKNNTDGKIRFSGQNSNGLAKLYIILFNKLKEFIISNGFVGFYTDGNYETNFFFYKKDKFDYNYWEKRIYPESLIGYTPETNMKKNIKESTTVSIVNSDGSSISITSDDMNELVEIMRNAGLSNYLEPKDDLGDLPIIPDDELEDTVEVDYDISDIPPYEYNTDSYDFGIDADDYDISYEDPYGNLADEVGYMESDDINENTNVIIIGNISNSVVKSIKNWCNNYDGRIDLVSIKPLESTKTIFKIECSDEITAEDFVSDFKQIYGEDFSIEIHSEITEVAELNASVPYEEDAEESLFNIKGTAHQSNLRYVPGMMSDNPMVDELRESNEFTNEINDAMTYCREDIEDTDMLDSLDLTQAGPIDLRYKHILVSKLANYLYTRYVKDITDGNTRLTPNNFEGIASVIFDERLWDILQDEGFYWTSNSDQD